ncbi:hypothetical protein T265_13436 [Opisthorchis viverrini]|uniref:Uncharacterized protein n=1 Tax=Opisthorchis viverrini TaxID=6198 RepID=A0A074ZP61_OPIVI|nr:hypothetical protein T265_13436 [Opisthorchis viverrini]KER29158.1 hypothetical protein T265_13436 [Opisthorchis viverrini]
MCFELHVWIFSYVCLFCLFFFQSILLPFSNVDQLDFQFVLAFAIAFASDCLFAQQYLLYKSGVIMTSQVGFQILIAFYARNFRELDAGSPSLYVCSAFSCKLEFLSLPNSTSSCALLIVLLIDLVSIPNSILV